MDVRFINPFIRSCHHLFDRHLGMKITVARARMKGSPTDSPPHFALAIAVDLNGAVRGRVKILFEKSVALALAGSLSGVTHERIDEATYDALRELANILVGTAKREFPGNLTNIGVPQVVSTSHDEFKRDRHVLVVPLSSMAGKIQIEVKIQAVANAGPAPKASAKMADPAVDEEQVDEMVAKLLAMQAE